MTNALPMFPESWKARMRADAQQFDPRNLRADSMTPAAMGYLYGIDPVLAYRVQTGGLKYGEHKDASESLFFARQLEFIRPGLLEVLFPALEADKFIPIETGIPSGANEYTYRSMKKIGRAQLIKDYSNDPPRVDVAGQETVQKLHSMGDMYGYTMQELRAAMMAQLPLDTRKAMSARYALALLKDEVMFYGHADITATAEQSATGLDAGMLNMGMTGIANLSNTTSYTVANGGTGSKLWRNKSPDEVVADLHGVVNAVVNGTFGIHRPDTLLLPLKAHNIAATKRMGDGSDRTILKFFLDSSPYVKDVYPTYRLDSAQSGNWSGSTGRMIAYEKNPERICGLLPLEFEQLPPEQHGFEIRTICHGRIGGTISPYPGSIAYGDGVTDGSDL